MSYRIVEKPKLWPCQDIITGRSEGPFVDLGRDFQKITDGRIYVHAAECLNLGRAVGMFDPETKKELEYKLAVQQEQIEALQGELNQLHKLEDALDVLQELTPNAAKTNQPKVEAVSGSND